jgi:hypothetical protein
MQTKTYRTAGEAIADPTSNIHRFIRKEAPAAMAHNPTSEAEWADYFAFLRDNPGCSTAAWRMARA